jgi:hypothetical protein
LFIELTEALRCPRDHEESYLVCVPAVMDGRRVVRGILGCPACQAEYPIEAGTVDFSGGPDADVSPPSLLAPRSSSLTAEAVQAFIALRGPGGYVLLVGSAGRLGAELAERLERVHVVGVNPPEGTVPTAGFSVLRSPEGSPVKRRSMRAVVVGADAAAQSAWLDAALDTVLPGLRAVIEDEAARPAGFEELARGAGVVVGERRNR